MKGRRTGIAVNERNLRKDSNGFDDIEVFWDATTSAARSSSILSAKSTEPYYDTSSVISEDESIITTATDEQGRPELSPITHATLTPQSTKPAAKRSLPVLNEDYEDDDDDIGAGFGMDDYDYDDAPFNADESPLAEKSPAMRLDTSVGADKSRKGKTTSATKKGSTKKRPATKTPESRKKKRTSFQTPATTPGDMSFLATPMTGEFPRAFTLPDDTFDGESGDETDEDDGDMSFQPDTSSFLDSARKHAALVTDDSDDEGHGLRRSKRATKGQTFKWWKGSERRVYQKGQLRGVLEGAATPAPKFKNHTSKRTKPKEQDVVEALDASELPEQYDYQTTETFDIWDTITNGSASEKLVCYGAHLRPQNLPVTTDRAAGKKLVCKAAQSFNVESAQDQSGWISGLAVLQPQAIKDAEGVGACAQVYFVADAQPNSLEVAIGAPDVEDFEDETAQRIILSAGDHFYVPPGNTYRLENHSHTKDVKMFWVIVKPVAGA